MAAGISVEDQKKQQQGQQGQQGAAAPGGNRSLLVQRLLDASANLPAFVNDLLTTQAVTVAGTEAAGFLIERGGGEAGFTLRPIAHIRPDQSDADTRQAAIQAFQEIVKPCVEKSKDGAIEVQGGLEGGESQFCLVTLLRSEGNVVAVSAVITRCVNADRARQRLMSMQLVAGYFELYTLRRNGEQARLVAQSHQHVLQLATSVATAEGFESAAMNLCNELATRANATRVSLGWLKGKNIKVKALSHTEQFDKKQELIVAIEKAMEECQDQEEAVQFDPNPGGQSTENVTRSHQALSRSQGGGAVLSLPLRHKDEIVGVVTLEFLPNQQVGPQVANALTIAVDLLAPQLWDRYHNDRWLITKAGISTRETAKMVIGPKHMLAKVVVFLVLVALLVVCNIPHQLYPKSWPGAAYLDFRPVYRVSAPFQFVSTERRTLPAPFDGELESLAVINGKPVKPGTVVKKGDVLAKMETTELLLQKNRYLSDADTSMAKYRAVTGDADPTNDADGEVALAEARSAEAMADLFEKQIRDAHITAPFDGVVLAGDLEAKQGGKFKVGEVLFEIGLPNALRAEVNVNERDVQEIGIGRRGELATRSLPREKFGFTVTRIVPMGDVKDGANTFRVYGDVDTTDPNWRPHMLGEARIDVGKRSWGWIWTHRLVDWVRLQLWM